jgi:allophanate hydrolase
MDQFATGLVGTRSPEPWGPCRNAFDSELISGGSSSGSAVAVALGLATFSLGTDTAGSGRVPAMLNNLYGLKPSRGVFSMTGVVPACRTLDCPSVFALCADDAAAVYAVAAQMDPDDAYARANPFSNGKRFYGTPEKPATIGVPKAPQLEFFGDDSAKALFAQAIERWQSLGATVREVDFGPLLEAARLLYEGPWVAERYAAIESMLETKPEAVHSVVRGIIESARGKDAVAAFKAEYALQESRSYAEQLLSQVDFLLSPTAPRSYTVAELLNDPVQLNSNMGYYTNYMNLLDLCGLAVPAGFLDSGAGFGVTMIAPRFREMSLLSHATAWEQDLALPMGATQQRYHRKDELAAVETGQCVEVAVCGAHLSGMPLNWQLNERGATLVSETRTSDNYRFYALQGGPVKRPGLVRDEANGSSVLVEVWSIPALEFGSFVAAIPYPLGIGKLELADGRWVSGFVCEGIGIDGAEEITHLGSWREYMAQG